MFYEKPYDESMKPKPTIDNIFNDIQNALDHVHGDSVLKDKAVEAADKYIEKSKEISVLLDRLNKNFKVFLMTNSNYKYVDAVMSYLVNGENPDYASWRDYFEFTIVSASKPKFFAQGSTFRSIDIKTGHPETGEVKKFEKHAVYQGGSVDRFYELVGIEHGNTVLYVGDSINTDVMGSSMREAWRTFLIVPELDKELKAWNDNRRLIHLIHRLEEQYAHAYNVQKNDEKEPPNVTALVEKRNEARSLLESRFENSFGSLYLNRMKNTKFSRKTAQHVDIYASSYLNLLNYTPFHNFKARYHMVPHLANEFEVKEERK